MSFLGWWGWGVGGGAILFYFFFCGKSCKTESEIRKLSKLAVVWLCSWLQLFLGRLHLKIKIQTNNQSESENLKQTVCLVKGVLLDEIPQFFACSTLTFGACAPLRKQCLKYHNVESYVEWAPFDTVSLWASPFNFSGIPPSRLIFIYIFWIWFCF